MATTTTTRVHLIDRVGSFLFGTGKRIALTITIFILSVFVCVSLYAVFGLPVFNGQTTWQIQYLPAINKWFAAKEQPVLAYAAAHNIDTDDINASEAIQIMTNYLKEAAFNKAVNIVRNISTNGVRPTQIMNSIFAEAGIDKNISSFDGGFIYLIALLMTLNALLKRFSRIRIDRKVRKISKQ
jgi:hypothetical protein